MAAGAAAVQGVQAIAQGAARLRANRKESEALFNNAERFEEMAQAAEINAIRRQRVFRQQASEVEARQAGAFSKAGVDFSGSVLNKLSQTKGRTARQLLDIRTQGEDEARANRDRAAQALDQASELQRPETSILSFLGGASPGISGGLKTFSDRK